MAATPKRINAAPNETQTVILTRVAGAGSGTETVNLLGEPISIQAVGVIDGNTDCNSIGFQNLVANGGCVYIDANGGNAMTGDLSNVVFLTNSGDGFSGVAQNPTNTTFDMVWTIQGAGETIEVTVLVTFR